MKKYLLFMAAALASILFAVSGPVWSASSSPQSSPQSFPGDSVNITLTIGDKVLPAVLYNTGPAKDLLEKLPVTVSLNRGPVDYCGGIAPIAYNDADTQAGYLSGDLAYWIPGQDFVIFTENKKDPAGAKEMVILGKINSDINEIKQMAPTIRVTIALE